MNARGVVVVFALCVLTCSMSTLVAADGWLPGFSSGPSSSAAPAKKSSTSSWWPWSSSSAKPKSKSRKKPPSTFDKMAKSTKNAWNKTADFLNPFDDKPAAKKPDGQWSGPQPWSTPSASSDKPTSVPDWMAGERPTF